jgi:hypothetical protein
MVSQTRECFMNLTSNLFQRNVGSACAVLMIFCCSVLAQNDGSPNSHMPLPEWKVTDIQQVGPNSDSVQLTHMTTSENGPAPLGYTHSITTAHGVYYLGELVTANADGTLTPVPLAGGVTQDAGDGNTDTGSDPGPPASDDPTDSGGGQPWWDFWETPAYADGPAAFKRGSLLNHGPLQGHAQINAGGTGYSSGSPPPQSVPEQHQPQQPNLQWQAPTAARANQPRVLSSNASSGDVIGPEWQPFFQNADATEKKARNNIMTARQMMVLSNPNLNKSAPYNNRFTFNVGRDGNIYNFKMGNSEPDFDGQAVQLIYEAFADARNAGLLAFPPGSTAMIQPGPVLHIDMANRQDSSDARTRGYRTRR